MAFWVGSRAIFICRGDKTVLDNFGYPAIFKLLNLLPPILCITIIASAMGREPGQVAVEYLEKVRNGKFDLKAGEDTAVSPYMTEEKRRQISDSIKNLSSQIGEGKLLAGETRLDGEFAAVMVTQGEELDQNRLQVYPVALVKGEKGWRAAPVLASYENAVFAYTVELRERLSVLETWMMRQRVLEIESLTARASRRLRERIETHFQVGDLANSSPVGILERFQQAYAKDRQMEVLGYLGGCSEKWPDDWDARMQAMRVAFSAKAREDYPWRLLCSPHVTRVVVGESVDERKALISLACLDPAWVGDRGELNGIHLVHFSFRRDEQDNWRLDLPDSLLKNDKEGFLGSQGMDDDLLEAFAGRLRKQAPAQIAESFEKVEQEVMGQLEHGQASELLRWVDFDHEPKTAGDACVLAMRDWWSIHAPGAFCLPVKMGSRVEGDWAVSGYHWFSLNQAERVEFKPMFFRKAAEGWVWVPGGLRNVGSEAGEMFSEWLKESEATWRENAINKLQALVFPVENFAWDRKIEDIEVRELAQKWALALKKNNIRELIRLSARLGKDGKVSQKLFRNLAYEISLAQRADSRLIGIYRSGKWIAAGFAHGEGSEKFFSLMLAVPTEEGLKALPEIDLISENNRTRKFLNKVSLEQLETHISEEEFERIKGMFDDFEAKMR